MIGMRSDIFSRSLPSARKKRTSPCEHDIAARTSPTMLIVKYCSSGSAEWVRSKRNFGAGARWREAPATIAFLNWLQVAAWADGDHDLRFGIDGDLSVIGLHE